MFINISNHNSAKWSSAQLEAAKALTIDGVIMDLQFPNVPPTATDSDIVSIADGLYSEAMKHQPEVVMVAGEFSLTYIMATLFLRAGIKVVAACSDRRVEEVVNDNGTTTKNVVFEFVQFREFPKL